MNELRIGVFGAWRGNAYIKSLSHVGGARVTAICDKSQKRIDEALASCGDDAPAVFYEPEAFFNSGLFDALFLCNYFTEHAHYAIRALKAGIHVFSETMAAVTMADAVALCRAAEESDAVYMMAENYPYSRGCFELKHLYEGGTLGKLMFAEGEYVHPMGPSDTYKYQNPTDNGEYHWRRYLPSTYYCSHALAPLIFATGEIPTRVTAMSAYDSPEHIIKTGRTRADAVGVMLLSTSGGAVMRVNGSSYCAPKGNWYRLSCLNGGAETTRGHESVVRLTYNKWSAPEGAETDRSYEAEWASDAEAASACGHSGGDYWVVRYFLEAIRGERQPFPDVYTACAMSAVAILGWRSVLNGSRPYDIPDFHDEEARRAFENDDANPFPTAGKPNNIPYTSRPVPPRDGE